MECRLFLKDSLASSYEHFLGLSRKLDRRFLLAKCMEKVYHDTGYLWWFDRFLQTKFIFTTPCRFLLQKARFCQRKINNCIMIKSQRCLGYPTEPIHNVGIAAGLRGCGRYTMSYRLRVSRCTMGKYFPNQRPCKIYKTVNHVTARMDNFAKGRFTSPAHSLQLQGTTHCFDLCSIFAAV